MNPRIYMQRFNISKKRVEKILPQPSRLCLVKAEAFNEILLSSIKDLNSHWVAPWIRPLASLRSEKDDSPPEIFFSLSERTVPCQGIVGIFSVCLQRSSHNSSMAANFSEVVILSRGRLIPICHLPFKLLMVSCS